LKLVLSRKGFDSEYGGIASPILPDGRLLSLPIPSAEDDFTLANLNLEGVDLGQLIGDLSRNRHGLATHIHLDPDLDRSPENRLPGWRPALGQTGSAQSHLDGQNVGEDDVFLFFGWFRRVEQHHGYWRYVPQAPNLHVIFGWLEVSAVLSIVQERERCLAQFPGIADHPHVANPAVYDDPRNTLYLAKDRSAVSDTARYGGGRFERYSRSLQLTQDGESRARWSLPSWFMPQGRPPLTYNPRPDQWQLEGDKALLRSAAKGQEFVLNGDYYPELEDWVSHIINTHA
jgi:hypothetical protein